ncbi:MAG: hypothetical protein AB2993_05010 [Candidatus Symbiodolus clandestinus]
MNFLKKIPIFSLKYFFLLYITLSHVFFGKWLSSKHNMSQPCCWNVGDIFFVKNLTERARKKLIGLLGTVWAKLQLADICTHSCNELHLKTGKPALSANSEPH